MTIADLLPTSIQNLNRLRVWSLPKTNQLFSAELHCSLDGINIQFRKSPNLLHCLRKSQGRSIGHLFLATQPTALADLTD